MTRPFRPLQTSPLLTLLLIGLLLPTFWGVAPNVSQPNVAAPILTGADQINQYLPYLKGKRIALVVNQTSIIGTRPSVDSLLSRGVQIVKIFGPEHGFRGNASNGAKVDNEVDAKTGIPIISLYGKNKKPSREHLADVDLLIYDIQDVGARFYTYINTLDHVMEACAENNKELMILDRPNPNGYVVDGPILEDHLHSGIGMHRIPITHGMTMAEFAQLINGEGWLPNKAQCKLRIVKVANYTHDMPYELPVMPSPNLNSQQSILLYPSICLFEGTIISQGRGTYMPFTVLGAPALKGKYNFSFRPVSLKGMSETPLHQDMDCYGLDLRKYDVGKLRKSKQLNLGWLMEMYKAYPDKERFFDMSQSKQINSIDKLAGTENLKKQIIAGTSEAEIRKSWEPGLSNFKTLRKKYLLYP
ncbi:exo-beta-N-acetylmuramidase NamZ family protein [Spirosoma jeollabukense]